ncbi:MAG TPA: type II secretion system protein, partial [Candidatus Paceibacterota bacterium]
MKSRSKKSGFTLVEVMIVLGVITISGAVVTLILNPAEIIRASRDSARLTDIKTLNQAIDLYSHSQNPYFGEDNIIYTSLPASPNTDCSDWNLPPITGWSYKCATEDNLRRVDGNGWIPINFTESSFGGSPLSVLPIDPVNASDGGLYYTYVKGSWELTAKMESNKFSSGGSHDTETSDGGNNDSRYQLGSRLEITPEELGNGGSPGGYAQSSYYSQSGYT